ncbi:MAG TPA: hypothetical protein VK468_04245 [Pyrinomonadaceae bacterium]|nr:hypothetical protein [Pyrinomonadaceae bacterium]
MPDFNITRRSYAPFVYALVSVACPFIALGLISIYQEYAYEWYWGLTAKPSPLDDADINAGAMMGFVIIVQAILAVGGGSLIGLVFAGMSLKRKPRVFSFGTAALLFNLIPVISVVVVYLRGRI